MMLWVLLRREVSLAVKGRVFNFTLNTLKIEKGIDLGSRGGVVGRRC